MAYGENMLFGSANGEFCVYGKSLLVIIAKYVAYFDKKSQNGKALLKR